MNRHTRRIKRLLKGSVLLTLTFLIYWLFRGASIRKGAGDNAYYYHNGLANPSENYSHVVVPKQSKRFNDNRIPSANSGRPSGSDRMNAFTVGDFTRVLGVLTQFYKERLDMDKTKIDFIGDTHSLQVGDVVKFRITLYDIEGVQRPVGGDMLKVRIFEKRLQASARGHVIDHQNGSYTATVKCLWVGRPTIRIYLGITREAMNLIELFTSQSMPIRVTYVAYSEKDRGRCHPFRTRLTSSRDKEFRVCNMTEINGGMSWYCEPPASRLLTCNDLKRFDYGPMDKYYQLEKMFYFIVNSSDPHPTFDVEVKGSASQTIMRSSPTPCNVYNRSRLWSLQSPVGYFFGNDWSLLHCTPTPPSRFNTCLRDRHIVLYGDSTVRQWFLEIRKRFGCLLKTEPWKIRKWSKDSTLYCPGNNLTIDLVFHSLPGNHDDNKVKFSSIARHLLHLRKRNGIIILIHLQNHFDVYGLDVYRERLALIRQSVESVLEGDPGSRIFIKGGQISGSMFDYKSVIYRRIVTEEFVRFRERLVYLDHMDMTLARHVTGTHPPSDMVKIMVNQMFGYVC